MLPLAGLYSRILQPLDLGFATLRNRVVIFEAGRALKWGPHSDPGALLAQSDWSTIPISGQLGCRKV